ncbi:MAG: hypothetical protein ACRCX8_01285 [Sarcina sp.]
MAKRDQINLSFKDNFKDKQIYNFINDFPEPTAYIKNLVYMDMVGISRAIVQRELGEVAQREIEAKKDVMKAADDVMDIEI